MKLFALPDGTVDRQDRAQWLTCPFDLAWSASVDEVRASGMRVWNGEIPQGRGNLRYRDDARANVRRDGAARGRVKRG